jgi:probable HAF family extracellular repeat protein
MRHNSYWICSLALLLVCGPTAALAAERYVVRNLDDLTSGSNFSRGLDINSLGQIAGYSGAAAGDRAILWTPTAPNSTYGSIIDLGDLPDGEDYSAADGVNSIGQVVGDSKSAAGRRAFLWTPTMPNSTTGLMVELDNLPAGFDQSGAFGINLPGQVAGYVASPAGRHAALWTPTVPNGTTGSWVDLGDLPGGLGQSEATGINSNGQVVGVGDAATGERAFLWTPTLPNGTTGSMVDLGDLPGGSDSSLGRGINGQGQVVGWSSAMTGDRAFLWTPAVPNGTIGSMVDLEDLPGGSDFSQAVDINSQGQVVGRSNVATGDHAFLWTPATPNGAIGLMVDLNSLLDASSGAGWTLETAQSINDLGQIAGYGTFDPDGPGGAAAVERGFLLTPVPEPSANVFILFGAFLLVRTRRTCA